MNENEAIKVLNQLNAFRQGHFVLTSEEHSDIYLDKNRIFENRNAISKLSKSIAEHFQGYNIDLVIGPESGGYMVAKWVSVHLSLILNRAIHHIPARKYGENTGFLFEGTDAYKLADKKILVVDDILTTGGSVERVVTLIQQECGGDVVGVGVLLNRSRGKPVYLGEVNPKNVYAIATLDLPTYDGIRQFCPLCLRGEPVDETVGHGKEFVKKLSEKQGDD